MNKKLLIFFGIFLFSLILIQALTIINFKSYSSPENLTFTGNENISRNLSISKYVNFTSAYMNLSGLGTLCYQESSNTSNQSGTDGLCNLNYTGNYFFTGNWTPIGEPTDCRTNATDGNWDTFCTSPSGYSPGYLYINYSVPLKFILNETIWQIKIGATASPYYIYKNITIPSSCLYSNKLQLLITLNGSAIPETSNTEMDSYCFNNSDFILLDTQLSYWSASLWDEAIFWNIHTINNSYISINNSRIWNFTGQFNQSNNKTSDFSSTLNLALNNGKCDCLSCSLIGNNCSIPFTFHSDIGGLIQYSDIRINYDPIPFVYLISPENATYSSFNKTFTCNATDEINLVNATLYVWNSTGIYNNTNTNEITGMTNSTTFNVINFSTSGNYTWNCLVYNNGSYSNWFSSNYTLYVDTTTPITTLNYPTPNKWLNNKSVDFNCTVEGNNLDSLFFYGNFTGSYLLNNTKLGISSGAINNFKLNLTDGSYIWTCGVNKTIDSTIVYSQYGNYTANVDTIFPTIVINSITQVGTTQEIILNSTSNDTNSDYCRVVVTSLTPTLVYNDTFICNQLKNITMPSYATYNLTLYAFDKANNLNRTSSLFTVSAAVTPPAGGGGGGVPAVSTSDWTMTTDKGTGSYEFLISGGGSRTNKNIFFRNNGTQTYKVTLRCSGGEICDYITFPKNPIDIPVALELNTIGQFNINLPIDIISGNYIGNVYGTDQNGKENLITLKINVGKANAISDFMSKLDEDYKLNVNNQSFPFPYFLIFIGTASLLGVILSIAFKKLKIPLYIFLAIIAAIVLSVLFVSFI